MTRSLGRDVLLVRRFDRPGGGQRRHVVSGLTMSGEDELGARYVTYPAILDVLREYGADPAQVGRELFARIAFNIAVGNSDDHARNHAAFWDGERLELTPAYDLAPGNRVGETATQAMAFDYDGRERTSNFAALLAYAGIYNLTAIEGREIIDQIVESIQAHWDEAADLARLTAVDKQQLWRRQILNPGALRDYAPAPTRPGPSNRGVGSAGSRGQAVGHPARHSHLRRSA